MQPVVEGAEHAHPRSGHFQRGAADASSARTVTATVNLSAGERVEGRLIRIDDFLVTVGLADGTIRSFRRNGDVPKVESEANTVVTRFRALSPSQQQDVVNFLRSL